MIINNEYKRCIALGLLLKTRILIHYVCNARFHWLWRWKFAALKSKRLCHESNDDVTSLATRRSNITKTFSKRVSGEWIRMVITRFVFEWFAGINWIILQSQIPVLPLRWRVAFKTKFATVKWFNLCLQIIQSQTCYPLNILELWTLYTAMTNDPFPGGDSELGTNCSRGKRFNTATDPLWCNSYYYQHLYGIFVWPLYPGLLLVLGLYMEVYLWILKCVFLNWLYNRCRKWYG